MAEPTLPKDKLVGKSVVFIYDHEKGPDRDDEYFEAQEKFGEVLAVRGLEPFPIKIEFENGLKTYIGFDEIERVIS